MTIINKSNGNDNLVLELDWNEVRSMFLALGEVTEREIEDAAWLAFPEEYFPKKVNLREHKVLRDILPWDKKDVYPHGVLYMRLKEILIERGEFRIETF